MGNVRGKLIGLNKILRMRSLHYSLEGYSISQVRTGTVLGHLAHRQKKTPSRKTSSKSSFKRHVTGPSRDPILPFSI
jgi:hypothetical protein